MTCVWNIAGFYSQMYKSRIKYNASLNDWKALCVIYLKSTYQLSDLVFFNEKCGQDKILTACSSVSASRVISGDNFPLTENDRVDRFTRVNSCKLGLTEFFSF